MKLLQLELDSLFKLPGLAGPFASCVWIKEGISTDGRNRIRCVAGLFQHVDIWMNENMEVNKIQERARHAELLHAHSYQQTGRRSGQVHYH